MVDLPDLCHNSESGGIPISTNNQLWCSLFHGSLCSEWVPFSVHTLRLSDCGGGLLSIEKKSQVTALEYNKRYSPVLSYPWPSSSNNFQEQIVSFIPNR